MVSIDIMAYSSQAVVKLASHQEWLLSVAAVYTSIGAQKPMGIACSDMPSTTMTGSRRLKSSQVEKLGSRVSDEENKFRQFMHLELWVHGTLGAISEEVLLTRLDRVLILSNEE